MKIRRIFILLALMTVPAWVFGDLSALYDSVFALLDGQNEQNAGLYAFPTLSIPMGGRREAMGTAYTAVAGDSGYIEANPAGSAEIANPALAFIHHQWIADTSIESVIFTTRLGLVGFGAAAKLFFAPFTSYGDGGERMGSGYYVEFTGIANASVRFISTPSFSLAAGISLKGVGRELQESVASGQSAYSMPIDAGLLMRLRLADFSQSERKNLSLGVSFSNLGQLVEELTSPLPTTLSAGLAYSPFRPLLISADIHIPVSLYQSDYPSERISYAAGLEVQIASFLALRAGARIQIDNIRASLGGEIDFGAAAIAITYNADIVGGMNPLDTMSIAATVNLGKGDG